MPSMFTVEVGGINERTVTTKFGPKKTYDLIATDGKKYQFPFSDPAKSGISVGTTFSAMGDMGRFGVSLEPKTVTIGETVSGTMPAPGAVSTSKSGYGSSASYGKVFPLPTTHGDTAIIRQNALTNAVATVADFVATQPTEKWPDLDKWTDMVITTAYKYAEFSSGQREVKAMKKIAKVGMEASEIQNAVEAHINPEETYDE
jgi:hypothetical protein